MYSINVFEVSILFSDAHLNVLHFHWS